MTMLRLRLLPAILALVGCDGQPQCVARGSTTTFSGSASYSGQGVSASTPPVAGAVPASVLVYDVTAACVYSSMEFTVGVGDCLLWAQVGAGASDAGIDFSATIEAGQQCTLTLANGPHTINITSGTLLVTGSTAQLTIAGNLVPALGESVADYLQWSFIGQ